MRSALESAVRNDKWKMENLIFIWPFPFSPRASLFAPTHQSAIMPRQQVQSKSSRRPHP